jgi:hypothetical protein
VWKFFDAGGNMIILFEEIRRCGGKEGCWGKKNPSCRKPVVIQCKRRPNVMIITEQMNIHEKEWRKKILKTFLETGTHQRNYLTLFDRQKREEDWHNP